MSEKRYEDGQSPRNVQKAETYFGPNCSIMWQIPGGEEEPAVLQPGAVAEDESCAVAMATDGQTATNLLTVTDTSTVSGALRDRFYELTDGLKTVFRRACDKFRWLQNQLTYM